MLDPARHRLLVARGLDAGVKPQQELGGEDRHRHSVKNDELQVQHISNAVHRLQDHRRHRHDHPQHDEAVEEVMQGTPVLAGEHQRMHLLAESAAPVGLYEFVPGGDQHSEDLEDPQQAQETQHPQVHRQEGLEVKGQDGHQVNDGEGASDIGPVRVPPLGELWVFRRHIQAQQVLRREDDDRHHIEEVEPVRMGLINRRHMLKQQGEQVGHDEQADPAVHGPLEVALAVRIEEPGVDP